MDLIKREDAINRMIHFFNEEEMISDKEPNERINKWRASVLFEDIPSAEPKQGEWISLHNGKWKCSKCGIEVLIYAKGNFCPNCGADMRGADDEHDK